PGSSSQERQKLKVRHRRRRPPSIRMLAPLQDRMTLEPRTQSSAARRGRLSSREAAIIRSLANGARNDEIAAETKVSEAALREHIKSILRKVRAVNTPLSLVGSVGSAE